MCRGQISKKQMLVKTRSDNKNEFKPLLLASTFVSRQYSPLVVVNTVVLVGFLFR